MKIDNELQIHPHLSRISSERVLLRRIETLQTLCADSVLMVGRAGKILEQMQEFWRHGNPIAAGSDLANEFTAWGETVMKGPMPSKETPVLSQNLPNAESSTLTDRRFAFKRHASA